MDGRCQARLSIQRSTERRPGVDTERQVSVGKGGRQRSLALPERDSSSFSQGFKGSGRKSGLFTLRLDDHGRFIPLLWLMVGR